MYISEQTDNPTQLRYGRKLRRLDHGADEEVMPWIDMANIACGFHASDPHVMSRTIDLALEHEVMIGAHPSYPDLQGFGRRSLAMNEQEVSEIILYQVGALKALCESKNGQLSYVKPHGALYNDMMSDPSIFRAVVDAVSCFNLPLMVLASANNQDYLDIADRFDVPLLFEAFADRTYLANGKLTPRSQPNAVLSSEEAILNQVRQIARYGKVTSSDGFVIPIEADTLCVHGDNPNAVSLIARIRAALDE